MEILQTDDSLREEIINDAKTKADRIIKKAKTEAENINKDIDVQSEKIKAEYQQNLTGEAETVINLLFASVDIEVKKEIVNICGALVDDVFKEVKTLILDNKIFKYKDVIFKLVKNSGEKIRTQSFILEIGKEELKKLGKEDLLKLDIQKRKIKKIINSDNLQGMFLYSEDKSIASYISIDRYFEDLEIELRTRVYEILIKGKI